MNYTLLYCLLDIQTKLASSESEREKLADEVCRLRVEVTSYTKREKSGESFFSKDKTVARSQGGASIKWNNELKMTCLRIMSRSIECSSIRTSLKFVTEGMKLSCQVPSLSTLHSWRHNDLAVHVRRQSAKFIASATELTIAVDDAAYKDHKVSGM